MLSGRNGSFPQGDLVSVSIWQDLKKLKNVEDRQFDIVIIGAGIAGLSTAYWLHKEDQSLKIALLEKGQVGDGATGRNAGFITCGSVEHFNRLVVNHGIQEASDIWKFSEKNLELLKEEFIDQNNNSMDFEEKGSFSLASTQEEFTELKKSFQLMKQLSIQVEVVDAQYIENKLGAKGFVGGIRYIKDACINPMKLANSILDRLKLNSSFTIFENHEVFSIENQHDSKMIKTKGGQFASSLVILATNGYSPLLDDYFKDKIFPTRGQIMATSSVPQFMEGPCYANFVLDYFRQLPSGEIIIGGFRQLQKDVEKGYSDEISDTIQSALENFLEEHIPLAQSSMHNITHRWSGIMGFSVDGQPLVGSLPTDNQTFFLGGFTAHGLGLAFHSAKCLVDCIFGRKIPSFISAKRF